MPVSTLTGQALGTAALVPGQPGAVGGPGGPGPVSPGNGWELSVVSAADYATLLAWVPSRLWNSFTFSRMLNSQAGGTQGSGTVVLNMNDPWWSTTVLPGSLAASFLLDEEHLWQVWQDGILRFEWLGETITEQLVQQGEQRLVTVTGPDTSQMLSWADAMPPGFPNAIVYKTDALQDGFSEVDAHGNFVLDTGLWNASSANNLFINPAGSAQLIASSGGTVLGSATWDLTNSLISAQVSPMVSPDAANNTLNGSQLTQMFCQDTAGSGSYVLIGMSGSSLYAQYKGPDGTFTHIIDSAAGYAAVQAGTEEYSFWQISQANGAFFFWTSADGQTWTQRWSRRSGWSATSVGVYFSSQYIGSTAEFATITSINSDVTTSSLGGATYFNEPIMAVWLQTLQAAQKRGTIPWVTTSMSASADSFGNPWTDSNSVQVSNGTTLYSLLQGQAAMINADWIMDPGFLLRVGIPSPSTPNTGTVTLGYDRSSTVRFYEGGSVSSKQRQRSRNQIANLIAAINADGLTVTAQNSSSIALWNQREAWVQAAAQVTATDTAVVAAAAAQVNASEILSWTLQIVPNTAGRTIFRDFNVGDWIGLERPDFSAVDAVRVVGITVSLDQDGNETHELVLVSYVQWLQQQLTYIQNKLGGGFISASGTTAIADNAQGKTLQPPTVFNEQLGSLGGPGSTGGAPMVYNAATGVWVPAGTVDPVSGQPVHLAIPAAGSATTVTGTGVSVGSTAGPGPINSNFNLPGGSTAGWGTQHLTLAAQASTSGPAGGSAYAAFQVKLTPTQNGAGCWFTTQTGGTQVPTIAAITAGAAYAVTAYVFLAAQPDMKIAQKVDWFDAKGVYVSTTSGTAGSIAASAWQQVTFTATAPGGAAQCNIFIGPNTAVTTNPLYVEDFYIYSSAFGASTGVGAQTSTTGTTSVGASGTTVTDGTGTVRAIHGFQADGTVTFVALNGPAPLAPDPPLVTATMLGVNVAWDGLLGAGSYGAGTLPLLDFHNVQVHVSTSNGFTPSSATLVHTFAVTGNFTVTQLTAATTYYVKLIAVNDSGVTSAASAQVSAVTQAVSDNISANSITTAMLQAGSVTTNILAANSVTSAKIVAGTIVASDLAVGATYNQNSYFAGSDSTGYGSHNGSLSTTLAPPAGAPYPAAAILNCNGGATPYLNAAQFAVLPGQFYMVTAWVYSASTSATIGLQWFDSSLAPISTSTLTVIVTANTWTQIADIEQAPQAVNGGANAAAFAQLQVGLAGTPSNGTLLYVQEALLLPSINGGVIEAGTITATQLGAASVVAGSIAAGAIDGYVISGAQINAASILGDIVILEGAGDGVFCYDNAPTQLTRSFHNGSFSWVAVANITQLDGVWCAGGGGGGAAHGGSGGGGGGGGGCGFKLNYAVTSGNTYFGAAGAAGAANTAGTGGDSWWNSSNTESGGVIGNGGVNAASTQFGAAGGSFSGGSGGFTGGKGGNGGSGSGGGGGGGGGGAGGGGSGSNGVAGQNNRGGVGGTGGAADTMTGATAGSLGGRGSEPGFTSDHGGFSSGGGGGGGAGGAGNTGGGGKVLIAYTPSVGNLTAAITGAAGTDPVNGTSVVAGGSFENLLLYGTVTPATPPAGSVIFYSSANGSPSYTTDSGIAGVVPCSEGNTQTFTANSGVETGVSAPFTIPANDANVGTVYRIKAFGSGTYSSGNNTWMQCHVYGAGQAQAAYTSLPSTFMWETETYMSILTTGSSGTAYVVTVFKVSAASANASPNVIIGMTGGTGGTSITVNTTVSTTMNLRSAGNGTFSIKGITSTFERLGT